MLTDEQLARLRDSSGERLAGRFELLGEAGSGGMGTVYRARDHASGGALVALKVLHQAGKGELARFEREAEVLARLCHPRIVGYLAHGTTDDEEPWLAMTWLEGETLGRKLENGARLPWSDAVTMAIAILDGLEAAHTAGVVHRDLKPANLFLVGGDVRDVRILDFGIARLDETNAETLTRTGAMIGTAGYLAPEQARSSHEVDARADLFALGCVLYRALTGVSAFGGEHVMDALSKLLTHDPLPVRTIATDVPPRLDALVRALMKKEPSERPASAAIVRDELRAILIDPDRLPTEDAMPTLPSPIGERVSSPVATQATPPPSRARWIAPLALALIAATAIWLFARHEEMPVTMAVQSERAPSATFSSACTTWASELASEQQADGAFGVERQRDAHGWPTAQSMFALATASRACGTPPADVLTRGREALERFRTDEGWRGNVDTSPVEVGATAWGVLATLALADALSAPELRAEASASSVAILESFAPDGGVCAERHCTTGAPSAYITVLGAWALTELAASDPRDEVVHARDAARAWLARAILDPRSDVALAEGLAEQAAVILARGGHDHDDALAVVAHLVVARCDLDEATHLCHRGPGRVGETYVDHLPGRGPNLVTFWFPWSTLAAWTIAEDPSIPLDPAFRASLRRVADAQRARVEAGLDLLEAAPTYETAEFLLMAAALTR